MNPRLQVQLAATVRVSRRGSHAFHAVTVNMSRSGALMESLDLTNALEAADEVYVEIELPCVHTMQQRCIACIGQVVRVEDTAGRARFALTFQTMQFRDAVSAQARYGTAAVM